MYPQYSRTHQPPMKHEPQVHAKELITVRHGETHAMTQGKVQGDLNGPEYHLNDKGKEQAQKIANDLKHKQVHTIISCGKGRCTETADAIKQHHPGASVYHDNDRLRGTDMGSLNGKLYNANTFSGDWRSRHPGVEDQGKVTARYTDALKDVISGHAHQSRFSGMTHVSGPEKPSTPRPGSPHRTVLVSHQWTNDELAKLTHNGGTTAKLGPGVDINKKEAPAGHSVIHFSDPDSYPRGSDGRVELHRMPKEKVTIVKKGD
ncbi:uncharacterized protein FA14DRAFT_179692 [Meira miltonrushii]|uniref:Phosphoglycerate mutase-like protein n=1 Tax=Meira miltonrushii TaxID=1280837 RepID=A0A316VG86_9BASI|nr:uncharacterized protein FA14DRAFT_179692 [Meira miltonrushii]PWN36334.1 hypothetical protein FA14DRAFT_179692 [Meira miltonrushii]